MPLHDVSHGVETINAFLAADVTIVSADTFTDGPSASFSAGVWLVTWKAVVKTIVTTSQSYWWPARLWDGSTIYDETEFTLTTAANYSGWSSPLSGGAVVYLGAPATLKVSVACGRGSSASAISRDIVDDSGSSHTATRLSALKVA